MDAEEKRKAAEEREKTLNEWLPITSNSNATWWFSAFHNVTAMVGAGVLGLPYAMSQLGWGPGIAVITLSWLITLYTLWQMVEMHEMTLVDTICKEFSDEELKLQAKVLSLSYSGDELSKLQKWSVSYTSNSNMQDLPFDAVLMTAPLSDVKAMQISRRGNPFSLDFLPEVDCLPLSIKFSTFKKANVKRPLEGFGVLIPSKEQKNGLKTLGIFLVLVFHAKLLVFHNIAPTVRVFWLYRYTVFFNDVSRPCTLWQMVEMHEMVIDPGVEVEVTIADS